MLETSGHRETLDDGNNNVSLAEVNRYGTEILTMSEPAPVKPRQRAASNGLTRTRASEMGKRSGEVKRERKALANAFPLLTELAQDYQREGLAAQAFAAASELIRRVVEGSIPVRNAGEAASFVRVLVDVGRLESGQHTSASVSVNVSATEEERRQSMDRLRAELDKQAPALDV